MAVIVREIQRCAGTLWSVFEGVAHTMAYDFAVLGDGTVPRERAALVAVPALVADGGASPDFLRRPAKALADAIPTAKYQTLEGQTHEVAPDTIRCRAEGIFPVARGAGMSPAWNGRGHS